MRSDLPRSRTRPRLVDLSNQLALAFSQKLVGQPAAINAIVPYIQMYQAGLCPEGRPIGVFMLLGPTGTGKTRTVEALAEVLHGSSKKMLKVDCGEFQMEHEVAKLIGAPPGYLGHRETQPMLTQQKLNGVSSEAHDVAILLFDEIEKAASSMTRLLLGVLDKATLRLGDNTSVNFEKTLIFMTTNLGAQSMAKALTPSFGFEAIVGPTNSDTSVKLEKIGVAAMRRKFPPEFVNRIDAVITYQPLDSDSMSAILDQQIVDLQDHIDSRLGARAFLLEVPTRTRRWLVKIGTSEQYGARELKRTLHRELIQPLACLLSNSRVQPGCYVKAELNDSRDRVNMRVIQMDLEELRPAS
jgi:ATP-dependent Clp protease ATP-binding subunit ClpA